MQNWKTLIKFQLKTQNFFLFSKNLITFLTKFSCVFSRFTIWLYLQVLALWADCGNFKLFGYYVVISKATQEFPGKHHIIVMHHKCPCGSAAWMFKLTKSHKFYVFPLPKFTLSPPTNHKVHNYSSSGSIINYHDDDNHYHRFAPARFHLRVL